MFLTYKQFSWPFFCNFIYFHVQLLKELTSVGNISPEAWEARFNDMKQCKDTYFVVIIEDTTLNKVCFIKTAKCNDIINNLRNLYVKPQPALLLIY